MAKKMILLTHIFGGRTEDTNGKENDTVDDDVTIEHEIDGPNSEHINHNYINSSGHIKTQKTFLGQSFHGSKRHLQGEARNAIAIVSEIGPSTLFLTLTCNHMWPEIQEALLPSQSAFDRPDIVCRVFKNRLSAFLSNLRAGKYFKHKLLYEIHVIEYQHRGLPHAHVVVKLEGAPNANNVAEASCWIDANLSAKMPIITDTSSEEDIRYAKLVKDHMVHKCADAVNGCLNKNGRCKRGYQDTTICQNTSFDIKGYPVYQRLQEADLSIVPHSREALLDWDGHLNIEFSGSSKSVLYLYKVACNIICCTYEN